MQHLIKSPPSELVVYAKDSILSVLKRMDKSLKRLYIVFNDKDRYAGLVSMGDIQRAIIENVSLEEPVKNILRKKNLIANINDPYEDVKAKMIEYRMEFMPILDDSNDLLGILLWENIFKKTTKTHKKNISIPVVIMAGGKGTRLKPITNILPKPLVPLGEKSIMEEIMNNFSEYDCNQFYISLNYKADFIEHFISTYINKDNKLDITYFREDKPLGTAGSLYLLKNKINTPFFISNCDILVDQDYHEIWEYHKKNENDLTIVSVLKHIKIPYGTVVTGDNGRLISMEEKPDVTFKINSGLYLLEQHLLERIPENKFYHITHLIEDIKNGGGKVGVFPVPEGSWKDIGEWDEYLKHFKK